MLPTTTAVERSQVVRLNIGGRIFVTQEDTLRRLPGTRLSALSPSDSCYRKECGEYFFDRNALLFENVLDLYRTGELHMPHCLCGPFVQQELDYWKIDDMMISDCCQRHYRAYQEDHQRMQEVENELFRPVLKRPDVTDGGRERGSRWQRWTNDTWGFLEDPSSGKWAKAWAIFFISVVMVAVVLQCAFSHPSFRYTVPVQRINLTGITNAKLIMYATTDPYPQLWYLEVTCIIIFTAELLLRYVVCPQKLQFFKSVYNVIDIISVLTMILAEFLTRFLTEFWTNSDLFDFVFFLNLCGVFRILRLIKFARHYYAMRVLLLAIRKSMRELLLLGLLIGIGMLIFSNLIYFAEFYNSEFETIPIGFWWSIVTMTTVGYGDMKPATGWGYLVGSLCALSGMLSTGLPIPIVAGNFNMYYTSAKAYLRKSKHTDALVKINEVRNTLKRQLLRNQSPNTGLEHKCITVRSIVQCDSPNSAISNSVAGVCTIAENAKHPLNLNPSTLPNDLCTSARKRRGSIGKISAKVHDSTRILHPYANGGQPPHCCDVLSHSSKLKNNEALSGSMCPLTEDKVQTSTTHQEMCTSVATSATPGGVHENSELTTVTEM